MDLYSPPPPAVVSPLLGLLLADGKQLVLQCVPAPLLQFTLSVMRGVFRAGPLQKFIATFTFDRRSDVTDALLLAAAVAVEERSVMITTPAAVRSSRSDD